jgi:hypothetical protein
VEALATTPAVAPGQGVEVAMPQELQMGHALGAHQQGQGGVTVVQHLLVWQLWQTAWQA